MRAGVHDRDAIGGLGDDAEIVRDEQQRQIELLLHLAQQVEDLRLHRDVERGRRLVGDDERRAAGERDRDHHALPHAARQLMRIVVDASLRVGDLAPRAAARWRAPRASARVARPCTISASAIWSPTLKTGIERGHRLLEDEADVGAAHLRASPLRRAPAGPCPGTAIRAAGDAAGRLHEPDDRERRDRLAAARFADEPERLALRISNDTSLTAATGPTGTSKTVRQVLDRRAAVSISIAVTDFPVFAEHAAQRIGDLADGGVRFDGGDDRRHEVVAARRAARATASSAALPRAPASRRARTARTRSICCALELGIELEHLDRDAGSSVRYRLTPTTTASPESIASCAL